MSKQKNANLQHFEDLPLESRVLIYLADRDRQHGRGDPDRIVQSDATDVILIFSSSYVHWGFEVLANTVSWSELREYSSETNSTIEMPRGHKALAAVTTGLKRRYNNLYKRLVAKGDMYAFTDSFRALHGLGGKRVPMLCLWVNRYRPHPITAVSLTESGFVRATEMSKHFSIIRPWQLHEFIVTVPGFLEKMQGKA